MPIDGEIVVRIDTRAGRVEGARVRSSRPHVAERLLTGRAASASGDFVATLFSICASAQAIAANAATDAALGRAPEPESRSHRERHLAAEVVQEHLWRLLLDWPRLSGDPGQTAALAEARALATQVAAARDAADGRSAVPRLIDWVSRHVYAEAPGQFLERESIASLEAWTTGAGTPTAALAGRLIARHAPVGASPVALLETGSDRLALALADAIASEPGFEARPHRGGQARETGVLARNAAHPLVAEAIARWGRGVGARLVARLVDLAQVLHALVDGGEPRCGAVAAGPGAGIGWVESARGLLMHFARVDGGVIAGYRIVAPTEWNFHPDGAMARGALAVTGETGPQVEERVRWLVASLDPCAGWRLETGHA